METAESPSQRTLLSINNYYYPRGGADAVFLEHNRLFEGAGWRVVPFAMRHPSNQETPWSDSFVSEIEFGSNYGFWQKATKAAKSVYSMEARGKIRELLDRVMPRVCHAHNIYHHISPSILPAVHEARVPLVITLHDLKLACPAYSMLSHDGICERCRGGRFYNVLRHRCMKGSRALSALVMFEAYLHKFLRSYVANVDRFVVPSRFHIQKFVEWGFERERFTHIPNFVDAANMRPEYRPGSRFLYFGRLSAEKGLHNFLRAAAAAKVSVDLVGRGPLEDELRELAAGLDTDIRFLGFLSGEALHSAIRSARATVVPSECYENAPLSILEAYALGKAVVGSSLGGVSELVLPEETGLIFEGGSVPALTDALQKMDGFADSRLLEMGKRGRALVLDQFSCQQYVRRTTQLYDSLTR